VRFASARRTKPPRRACAACAVCGGSRPGGIEGPGQGRGSSWTSPGKSSRPTTRASAPGSPQAPRGRAGGAARDVPRSFPWLPSAWRSRWRHQHAALREARTTALRRGLDTRAHRGEPKPFNTLLLAARRPLVRYRKIHPPLRQRGRALRSGPRPRDGHRPYVRLTLFVSYDLASWTSSCPPPPPPTPT
jgi:hypothetical protein